jgi:hypothetical protein
MTAKEFVKIRYPKARAEKQNRRGPFKKFYWLIFDGSTRLGDGDENKPQSNAWVNARNAILEREREANQLT